MIVHTYFPQAPLANFVKLMWFYDECSNVGSVRKSDRNE